MFAVHPLISEGITNITRTSVTSAGVAGIFGIANPRATAVATLAGGVAGTLFSKTVDAIYFEMGWRISTPPTATFAALALFCGYAGVTILAGTKAGQQVDKNFGYFNMCVGYYSVVIATSLVATAIGIKTVG